MWHIGNNNGSAGFSYIPIDPKDAFRMRKTIVPVKDGGKDLSKGQYIRLEVWVWGHSQQKLPG
jgi:hypothetical protein